MSGSDAKRPRGDDAGLCADNAESLARAEGPRETEPRETGARVGDTSSVVGADGLVSDGRVSGEMLLEYHCDELNAEQRALVEQTLAVDAALRTESDEIQRVLSLSALTSDSQWDRGPQSGSEAQVVGWEALQMHLAGEMGTGPIVVEPPRQVGTGSASAAVLPAAAIAARDSGSDTGTGDAGAGDAGTRAMRY